MLKILSIIILCKRVYLEAVDLYRLPYHGWLSDLKNSWFLVNELKEVFTGKPW